MDAYSYVTCGRIRALVVPVGGIKYSHFKQYFSRLETAAEVRLADVSSDSATDRSMFSPQGYPNGRVTYLFETAPTQPSHAALFDIEPWRQQLVVVGVAHQGSSPGDVQKAHKELKEKFPKAIYHTVLVFGMPNEDESKHLKDIKDVYPILASNYTSLESTLAEVTGSVLAQLAVHAISRKMGSFKSPGLKLLDEPSKNQLAAPKGHGHNSSSLGITRNGSISTGLTERTKTRQRGRTFKFMGSLYLLAGRLPDALNELAEAAAILRQAYDHLWFASALEQIGVCLVLQQFNELPVSIPSVAVAAVDGDGGSKSAKLAAKTAAKSAAAAAAASMVFTQGSHSSASSAAVESRKSTERAAAEANRNARQALADFLPGLMDTVLRFYGRCAPESEEAVPHTIYHDTVLRYASFLAALRLGGGWTPAALSAVVRNTPLSGHITVDSPPLGEIEAWCSLVYGSSLDQIQLRDAVRLLSALASIYRRLDMRRKWALVVSIIFKRLETQDVNAELAHELGPNALEFLLEEVLSVYDWPELRIQFLKHAQAFLSKAGYSVLSVRAASQLLKSGSQLLTAPEQNHLYEVIRTESEGTPGRYWDSYLLRNITVPQTRASHGYSSSYGQPRMSVADINQGNGPGSGAGEIIYNPFENSSKEPETTMVVGERAVVAVHLQNPFVFPLDIFELALVNGDGKHISATKNNISLSPDQVSQVLVEIIPEHEGLLDIAGAFVHVGGCTGEIFWLRTQASKDIVKQKPTVLSTVPERAKRQVSLNVAPARPSLVLQKITLPKGWVMLLEGEKIPFSLGIFNVSETEASIMDFGFNDSTVEPLKQAIAKPENTRAEVYEYEYFLHIRRAIQMTSVAQSVPGNSTSNFDFELWGKRGVTSATILINYGTDPKYMRRLRVPLSVTVYPSIELERADLLPLPDENGNNLLVVLDLRNMWRQALDVTISSMDGTKTLTSVTHRIDSQRARRFLVPLHWITPSDEQLAKPIPSLAGRQMTVDKTSPEAVLNFWLREALLEKLQGSWKLASDMPSSGENTRAGSVELRGIQLSKKMSTILRAEPIQIAMQVSNGAGGAQNALELEKETTLRTTLVNKSSRQRFGMLRLVPNETKNLLWIGSLQQPVMVEANAQVTVDLQVIALARGKYNWTAIFDIIGGGQAFLRERLDLTVV